jgi:DedD protein
LTGAVILVALVVLVVPELLSGPRHAEPQPAVPGEALVRSYTIPLQDVRAGDVVAPAAPGMVGPQPSSASAATAAVPVAQPAPAAEPLPAPAVHTVKPAHAMPTQSKRAMAAAPRPANHTRQTSTAPRSASSRGWSVQVGSFLARDHAERLVRELRARGYRASVSPIVSRSRRWYRVRVGPQSDRATAAAVARRLRAAGHPGELVRAP